MTDDGVVENGEVWVTNGRIREVGRGIGKAHPGVPVHDLGRAALLPGFVNTHSHVEYTLQRNSADGLSFWDWIESVGFRRSRTPPSEVMLASARLGVELCVESGVTSIGDCSYSGIAAEAIDSIGGRGVVFKELFGQSMGDDYPARVASVLDEVRALQSQVSQRVKIGISPHAVYSTNAEVLELCAELHIPVAMHLAETRAEEQYTTQGAGPIADWRRELGHEPMVSGLTPTRVLERAGLLRQGVLLAHCVHLAQDEIDLIAASGASIAHCPRSNAYLGAGIAPLARFRRAGVRVGLGTDSAASCLRLDFFEEMRFALGLHRVAEDAGVLLAKDVLKLATRGGADALGLGGEIGRIEPGMRADMIAIDLSGILPGEDIYLAVLSRSAADVTLRMVDGNELRPDAAAREAELSDLMEHQDIA